jgi:3-oxoacyl-[acyl-carrier-protein] synthase-3
VALSAAAGVAGSRLLGFGAAQPDTQVTAEELGRPFGKSEEWVRTRTGICSVRRFADPKELRTLADAAARNALSSAGLVANDIDLLITASCSAEIDDPFGSSAAPHAARLRLNAACSGFAYAISAADGLIRTGSARRVLVVAAEHMSRLLDPDDLGTSIIFGDGAGAAVLGSVDDTDEIGVGPAVIGSDGVRRDLIRCEPGARQTLRMTGQEVFRWAVSHVPGVAREACRRAGVALADIDVFVPHQANLRIIDAVVRSLGIGNAVVADDIIVSGNTSAASIPIAATRLLESGRARAGQLALFVGFGAGLAYAAQVVRLPGGRSR